jgi:uncharacterized protein (UPF0147 family)
MDLESVIEILRELEDDSSVSKGIKVRIVSMRLELENADDMSLSVNKVLSDLEDLSGDVNIPAYVRTQFWHITSVLETLS